MKRMVFFILIVFMYLTPAHAEVWMKDTLTVVTQDGRLVPFEIELALSPEQHRQGLMHRTNLPETEGMLFWFGAEEEGQSFWMRNVLIPLDMIFIKADGTIAKIHENAKPQDVTPIPSGTPISAVLELGGGVSAKMGLKAGDKVHHTFFGNTLAQ